jgi:cyanophycin synthetase
MARHLAHGGRAVYENKGMLVWADGGHHVPLVASSRLPSTLGGRARHNVANAMAVFAALLALAVPRERIVSGLATFSSNESQNPLRLNVYRTHGVTLMVDYAHNAAAYQAIIATGRQLTTGRLIGVVTAPGDRREEDLIEIGRICGAGFDGLVVYEMDDRRGKQPGATAAALLTGAAAGREGMTHDGQEHRLDTVLDVREAIRAAVQQARPGDLVIVGCASHLSELREALANADLSSLDDQALAQITASNAPAQADAVVGVHDEVAAV